MFQSSSGGGGLFSGESSSGPTLPTFQEEPACAGMCPKLTYQQRIIGFGCCAAIGWILSFIGTLTLIGGFSAENLRTFVALYVIGNVIALCATGFLLGPKQQCIKMWAPTRRYSTAFYLIMLIVVLVVALTKQNIFLILFLLVIEIMAALWYSLSFIPFGRKMCLAFLRKIGICMPCFAVYDASKEAYDQHNKEQKSQKSSFSVMGGEKKKESSFKLGP